MDFDIKIIEGKKTYGYYYKLNLNGEYLNIQKRYLTSLPNSILT